MTALTSNQFGGSVGLELSRGRGDVAEADTYTDLVDGQVIQGDNCGRHWHQHCRRSENLEMVIHIYIHVYPYGNVFFI